MRADATTAELASKLRDISTWLASLCLVGHRISEQKLQLISELLGALDKAVRAATKEGLIEETVHRAERSGVVDKGEKLQ